MTSEEKIGTHMITDFMPAAIICTTSGNSIDVIEESRKTSLLAAAL